MIFLNNFVFKITNTKLLLKTNQVPQHKDEQKLKEIPQHEKETPNPTNRTIPTG